MMPTSKRYQVPLVYPSSSLERAEEQIRPISVTNNKYVIERKCFINSKTKMIHRDYSQISCGPWPKRLRTIDKNNINSQIIIKID